MEGYNWVHQVDGAIGHSGFIQKVCHCCLAYAGLVEKGTTLDRVLMELALLEIIAITIVIHVHESRRNTDDN